jgi:hypothetical protein
LRYLLQEISWQGRPKKANMVPRAMRHQLPQEMYE